MNCESRACGVSDKISGITGRFLFVCGALLLSASAVFADGEYQRTKDGKTIVWNNDPKPGETASWFGDRDAAGYATKVGTLTWYTADGAVYARYFGNMVSGKFDGMVNCHSKGKTGHAIFVDGQQTTRWVVGRAPSFRVALQRTRVVRRTENPASQGSGVASAHVGNDSQMGSPTKNGVREQGPQPASALAQRPAEQKADIQRPTSSASRTSPIPSSEAVREQPAKRPTDEAPAEGPPIAGNVELPTPNAEYSVREAPAEGPAGAEKTQSAISNFTTVESSQLSSLNLQRPSPNLETAREQASESPSAANPESTRGGGEHPIEETPAEGPPAMAEKENLTSQSEEAASARSPKEDRPSIVIEPGESAPNLPTGGKETAEADAAVRSLAQPPSSLRRVPETAAAPEAHPRLTKEEVIRIANAEARTRGYNRVDYYMTEPEYKAAYKVWSVSYEPGAVDGTAETDKRFSVIVDDKTKGTVLVLHR
jgi:hypothetical protein